MDRTFVAPSGLAINWNHDRAKLTHDTTINLTRTKLPDGRMDVKVCTGAVPAILEPLSTEIIEKLRQVLSQCRQELVTITNSDIDVEVQNAMLWVIEAFQIRMNQHYRAVNASTVLSMESLLGLLTVQDHKVAEDQMMELMESLTVNGDEGVADMPVKVETNKPATVSEDSSTASAPVKEEDEGYVDELAHSTRVM